MQVVWSIRSFGASRRPSWWKASRWTRLTSTSPPAHGTGPRRQQTRQDHLGRDDVRQRRERPGHARGGTARPDRPGNGTFEDRWGARPDGLREAEAPRLQAGEPPGEPDEPDRRRRDDLPRRPLGAREVARGVATGAPDWGWAVRTGTP